MARLPSRTRHIRSTPGNGPPPGNYDTLHNIIWAWYDNMDHAEHIIKNSCARTWNLCNRLGDPIGSDRPNNNCCHAKNTCEQLEKN